MKRTLITLMLIAFCSVNMLWAQEKQEEKKFSTVVDIPTTTVKNQQSTGTCWCYAGISYIETELLRLGAPEIDLSEMYIVRLAYTQKAKRYFRVHGKGNYSEGGQAHDVLNVVKENGFVPETIYSGNRYGSDFHIHKEMVKSTKSMLDEIVKKPNRVITPVWEESVNGVLDTYMGKTPKTFTYEGTETTPAAYAEKLGFNTEDYIEITSYNHHPFYEKVNLEIPDNWSDDLYYNVPMDEMMDVINYALNRPGKIKGLIVTSPFLRLSFTPPSWKLFLGKLMGILWPSITLPNELELEALSRDQNEITAYMNDPMVHDRVSYAYSIEFMDKGEWAIDHADQLQIPMLLLHGTADRLTDHKASEEFAQKAGNIVEYQPVEGGFHELHHDLDREVIIQKIITWIHET